MNSIDLISQYIHTGPTYVAHIPPLEGWYSRDSLCCGVGACMAYITAKCKKKEEARRRRLKNWGCAVDCALCTVQCTLWVICSVFSLGPNCPGPNCPGAQLSTFSVRTVGPRGPIVHFFKMVSWDPGPNCPLFQSGHSGPGKLGPGAKLSGAQLSIF